LERKMSLDLTQLLKLTNEMSAYHQLVKGLSQSENSRSVMVLDATKPYLTAALYHSLRRPVFIITAQPEDAQNLHEQLSTWLSSAKPRLFPQPDALPYQRIASDAPTELERLQVLSALASLNGDPGTPLVITSVLALTQKIVPRHDFITTYHSLKMGQEIEPLSLLKRWQTMGYRLENLVEIPGTISHRGGIVDIYPPSSELPARVEFYGNTVDAIRLFDPLTQRSQRAVTEIAITPATELATPLPSSKGELELTLRSLDLRNCNPKASEEFRQDLALLTAGQRPKNLQFYAPLLTETAS
jgi:transcription-repair coupling factor (superfamily II helicase)